MGDPADTKRKVVVVFGAGGGLGAGMASEFAAGGARVVISDYEQATLTAVHEDLRHRGDDVVMVRADISKLEEVVKVRDAALDRYGDVDVVCNTVGVAGRLAPVWEIADNDWRWNMAVNFWGVLHVIQAFVPVLMKRGGGHILNTASTAVFTPPPGPGAYVTTKHAVIGVSEVLQQDLRAAGSDVRVSVILPGVVRSQASSAQRNRQPEFAATAQRSAEEEAIHQAHLDVNGTPGELLARRIIEEMAQDKFYIFGRAKDIAKVASKSENTMVGALAPPPGDLSQPYGGVYGALA
jgi:NAD(P)-dependent dehydrogenase (short-subunit alcohol dehydrogenase family)